MDNASEDTMSQNKWTRGQPELATRVQELVRRGKNRSEISDKLSISRYMVDRFAAAPSQRVGCRCCAATRRVERARSPE